MFTANLPHHPSSVNAHSPPTPLSSTDISAFCLPEDSRWKRRRRRTLSSLVLSPLEPNGLVGWGPACRAGKPNFKIRL